MAYTHKPLLRGLDAENWRLTDSACLKMSASLSHTTTHTNPHRPPPPPPPPPSPHIHREAEWWFILCIRHTRMLHVSQKREYWTWNDSSLRGQTDTGWQPFLDTSISAATAISITVKRAHFLLQEWQGQFQTMLLSNSKGQLKGMKAGCYCQKVRDSWRGCRQGVIVKK